MAFKLSNRSKVKLEGVHPDMVAVVERAIELTSVDFGVTYGVRTVEEQEKLKRFKRTFINAKIIEETGRESYRIWREGDYGGYVNAYRHELFPVKAA